MMAKQLALFLETQGGDFVLKETDIPKPGDGEILVKLDSVALNPIDWKIQRYSYGQPYIHSFPAILGLDSAGVVEAVGDGVTNFAAGDPVLFGGHFMERHAAYQQYSVVPADVVAKIPSNLSFEQAASVPLGLTTAALGLYSQVDGTGAKLAYSWDQNGKGAYDGKPILIIGGASSVGQYAIQLAKMSGFSPIITTASPQNTQLLKSIGATHVVDRTADILAEVRGITSASIEVIYDTVSLQDTQTVAWEILADNGYLVTTLPGQVDLEKYKNKKLAHPIGVSFLPHTRPTCSSMYSKLTQLLADGTIKPNAVEVIPGGLNGIIGGFRRMENNEIRAKKLVVKPQTTSA